MEERTRTRFKVYLEKMQELLDEPFTQAIMTGGTAVQFENRGTEIVSIRSIGPDQTALKSFAATFRLFVQRRDGIDFDSLAETTRNEALSDRWKSEIVRIRNLKDAYFAEEINEEITRLHIWAMLHIPTPIDTLLTRKDVFDVIFYGDIVHVNEDKRAVFECWRENKELFPFLMQLVQWTLYHILKLIEFVGDLIKEELDRSPR